MKSIHDILIPDLNPQEQALQILTDHQEICVNDKEAKDCAIYAVQLLIESLPPYNLSVGRQEENISYWANVKFHLEKL